MHGGGRGAALLKGTECWTQNISLTRMIYYFEQNRVVAYV
jgi:hypothetical protein